MYREGKCPQIKENLGISFFPDRQRGKCCKEKIMKARYGGWPDCNFECYRSQGGQNFAKVCHALWTADDIKKGKFKLSM
jgi:hypothetical protein